MEAMIFKVPPEDPLTDCATVSGACPRAAPSRSSGRAFIVCAYREEKTLKGNLNDNH
jgi:hypothetical protein